MAKCLLEPGHQGRCVYPDGQGPTRCAHRAPSGGRCRHDALMLVRSQFIADPPLCEGHGLQLAVIGLKRGETITLEPIDEGQP